MRQFLANTFFRVVIAILLAFVIVYVLILRNMYYRPSAAERSAVGNNWTKEGFSVAVVWPKHTDLSLVEGIQLAWEQLNASSSPLAKKIRLQIFNEKDDRGAQAREVAKLPDVLAVIGHEIGDNAIPASTTYQEHGILFISPKSTNIRLTTHGFNFVFRMTPDDTVMSRDMAKFAMLQKWKNIGILYGQHEHGVTASGMFLADAKSDGLEVPFFRSYLGEKDWVSQDNRPLVAEIMKTNYDAIMLADVLPWAAKLIVDMARMGVMKPIFATDKLDSLQVWQIAQVAANNLYVASVVDPESQEPEYAKFREAFRKRYNSDPGYGASQGYESFQLFVKACELSQSADPIVLATTLRTVRWHGIFGEYAFAQNGDILGRDVSVKKMHDGRFTTVSTLQEDIP